MVRTELKIQYVFMLGDGLIIKIIEQTMKCLLNILLWMYKLCYILCVSLTMNLKEIEFKT